MGQFVHPLGGEGMGQRGWMEGIVILASYKFHFVRVHQIIWCVIQVIINKLTGKLCVLDTR